MSLFVAGAVLGEGPVSLFVAGAVLGEIWKGSRSAKCCIFLYKMVVKVTSVAPRVADSRVHARNGLGSFSDRPRIGNCVSLVFLANFCPMLGGHFA